MKTARVSHAEIARGRRSFLWFNAFNAASFQLLSGNIITLYVLRLDGGSLLIGLLSALMSFSPVLVLAGRPLASRMKATVLMGSFWIARYIFMLPLVFSPPLALTGFRELAVVLIVVSVAGFNVARGIAITTFNPILGELAGKKDRGEFISSIQLVINIVTPLAGVAMALTLGSEAPLGVYAILFSVGILSGFGASYLVFKLPEPREYRSQTVESLPATMQKAFRSRSFVKFTASFFAVTFVTSMAGPFLIVSLKSVYAVGESVLVLFTVIGGLGAIAMAVSSGLAIDRIGAKPLFFFFTAAALISLMPLIASPHISSAVLLWIFAGGLFFLFSMGSSGASNAAQTYFFSIASSKDNLNLGILYQIVAGVSGAAGAVAGGAVLELLQRTAGREAAGPFRLFFGIAAALFVVTLLLVSSLENIGAYSLRDSLGIIFSPRDIRALSLLRRLGRSRSMSEERHVIDALAASQSEISTGQLLAKLQSPRFTIRSAALSALRALPVDERIDKALIEEVKNHPYTTAYIAADILGEKGVRDGVPALRQGLGSRDYFLAGKCMVSLAKLGDSASLPEIRRIVARTDNPRLIIHGATAMEIARDAESVGLLLEKMWVRTSPYMREELILSIAGIIGMQEWFYPLFTEFMEDQAGGTARLLDIIESSERKMDRDYSPLLELAANASDKQREFADQAADILRRMTVRVDRTDVTEALAGSALDPRLSSLPRYRFFLACLIVWLYLKPR